MQSKGQYTITPGSTLDTDDFVQDHGVWYRLTTLEDQTQNKRTGTVYTRRFRGVAKDGSARHILLDSSNVKAYRLHR